MTTRFLVSNSCATGFPTDLDEFDDQIMLLAPLKSTKFPLTSTLKTPEVSASGVSLLATHRTVLFDIFL